MRNTFDIAFYCRSSRMNKNGIAPIEMSVSLNGERAFVNLPMKAEPGKFASQAKSTKSNAIRSYLAMVESKMNTLQVMMAASEQVLTLDRISDEIETIRQK